MRVIDHRDERGSIIIAVGVMMVAALLSVAVVARTMSSLTNVRQSQNFSAALANADAGVSDALFRIDQFGTANPSAFCVGSSAACTLSSVPGAPGVQYTARFVDSSHMTILAKGLVNGVPHGIQADAIRDQAFRFAIFGRSSLTFNGNDNGNIYTVDASGRTVALPPADAGSNGTITCNGGSPAAHHVAYPGGSTNCLPAVNTTGTYNPQDPVTGSCPAPPNTPTTPCLPSLAAQSCPGLGAIPATVLPGQYLCTSTVTFPATFTVGAGSTNGGVVEIFIIPPSGRTADMNMPGSNINVGGDPTKLRVYMAGAGSVVPGTGSHAGAFTGIMYAPSSNMTSNGCKVLWRGAIIFNTATCNGGPHLTIQYDTRVAALMSVNWRLTNYTEIPSSQVVLP